MSVIHTTVDRIIETALVRRNTFAKKGLGTGFMTPTEPDSRIVADDILLIIAAQIQDDYPEAADFLRSEVETRNLFPWR